MTSEKEEIYKKLIENLNIIIDTQRELIEIYKEFVPENLKMEIKTK